MRAIASLSLLLVFLLALIFCFNYPLSGFFNGLVSGNDFSIGSFDLLIEIIENCLLIYVIAAGYGVFKQVAGGLKCSGIFFSGDHLKCHLYTLLVTFRE